MSTNFKVTVEIEDARVRRVLAELRAFCGDARPLMAYLAEGLFHRTQDRFDTQTAPDGHPWQELTAGYREQKLAKGYPATLLVMERRLRDELRPDFGADFAEVATAPLPYAALHQFGGTSGMAPGPAAVQAREYLGLSEEDGIWIEETVVEFLAGIVDGA